jgi:phosphoribosylcarboxyaminoimidazole (NCAIR) mutase
MVEPDAGEPSVVVVLGPAAQMDVVDHMFRVLHHYGIPFRQFTWSDFADSNAGSSTEPAVIIFATGVAYTDEHLRLLETVIAPVIRFVTDSEPPKDTELVTSTALMASVGFGVPAAVNAGLQAARILATANAALRDLLKTKPYPPP